MATAASTVAEVMAAGVIDLGPRCLVVSVNLAGTTVDLLTPCKMHAVHRQSLDGDPPDRGRFAVAGQPLVRERGDTLLG